MMRLSSVDIHCATAYRAGTMRAVGIRSLTVQDAPACDRVIATLPYFFGQPAGIEECAAAVRSQRGLVADQDGDVIGFLTLRYPFPASPEISWMAVRRDRRRSGVGHALVSRAVELCAAEGAELMSVLTLGESVPEPGVTDGYAGTRLFYRRMGFASVMECQPAGWSSPALLLVRPLRAAV